MGGRVLRSIIWLHRYMGIAVGLLMTLWCLSGAVMMYVPYPDLNEEQRLQHLAPLDWRDCCEDRSGWQGLGAVTRLQVEALSGHPVARVTDGTGAAHLLDLSSGRAIQQVSALPAAQVAAGYTRPGSSPPRLLESLRYDQWTVQGARGTDRPLWHFALNDGSGSEVYVSSVTGKAIQLTTPSQRLWNWLGSIPHWLYFAQLRENAVLWSQVVVWTSLVGVFLTVTGVYLGVSQLRPSSERPIPYRGLHYWHHLSGLIFGVVTLTWVTSGLISMNPWGFLEGTGFGEVETLRGAPIPANTFAVSLRSVARVDAPLTLVSLEAAPLGGELFWAATDTQGHRLRLDAEGHPAPLATKDLDYIARTLDPRERNPHLIRLDDEDTYYFSHHRQRAPVPVYRLISTEPGETRYYIDPVDGRLRARIDGDGRWYRWLHQGLHRVDFTATLRAHPLWDLVTLPLLCGASVVCGLGAYLGLIRISRKR